MCVCVWLRLYLSSYIVVVIVVVVGYVFPSWSWSGPSSLNKNKSAHAFLRLSFHLWLHQRPMINLSTLQPWTPMSWQIIFWFIFGRSRFTAFAYAVSFHIYFIEQTFYFNSFHFFSPLRVLTNTQRRIYIYIQRHHEKSKRKLKQRSKNNNRIARKCRRAYFIFDSMWIEAHTQTYRHRHKYKWRNSCGSVFLLLFSFALLIPNRISFYAIFIDRRKKSLNIFPTHDVIIRQHINCRFACSAHNGRCFAHIIVWKLLV